MKRFRFTLQALQTVRQRRENQAMAGYGAALLERQMAIGRVERAERELARAWEHLRERMASGCSAGAALQERGACLVLEERRRKAVVQLGEAERAVQAAFEAMLLSRREREVVDHLRARQRRQFDRLTARDEAKLQDELAMQRLPGRFARHATL